MSAQLECRSDQPLRADGFLPGKHHLRQAEAVGDTALIVPVESPHSITNALDLAASLPPEERAAMAERAREHALQFDRMRVFDRLLERVTQVSEPELYVA